MCNSVVSSPISISSERSLSAQIRPHSSLSIHPFATVVDFVACDLIVRIFLLIPASIFAVTRHRCNKVRGFCGFGFWFLFFAVTGVIRLV